jgi:hypothetical protein
VSRAEVVEQDVLFVDAEVAEHVLAGVDHERRSAQVVLDVFRGRVVLQVVVVEHLMDEALEARPVVLGQGIRERQVPLEVLELRRDGVEVLHVEGLAHAAGAVPVAHLAVRVEATELIEDVGAHGRHARTAPDEDHLVVGAAGEELAVGPRDRDLVPGLEIEDVGGHLARGRVRLVGRRRCDADVQHDDARLARVVRHRIGALDSLVDLRREAPQVVLVPVVAVLLLDVEIAILRHVGRALDLDVAPGAEGHLFTLRQLEHQLLDEGGHVVVRTHATLPALHAEDLGGDLDRQVVLHLDLAGQAYPVARLPPAHVGHLCGEQRAAALANHDLAHAAGALSSAGRRDEDPVVGERSEQGVARVHLEGSLRVVVDRDLQDALGQQAPLGEEQHHHEADDHDGEEDDAEGDGQHGGSSRSSGDLVGSGRGTRAGYPRTP